MILGAVTNFFDTLGIGSFAPTMAWMKFRKLVPDRLMPMTMLAGYTPPSVLQAVIFLILLGVQVDLWLLLASAIAILVGALVGAPIAARSPVRIVQAVVAGALLMAALFYTLANLDLMPLGGTATSLPLALSLVVIAANFVFGVLLNFGVGSYAPTLAILSLFGMDPRLAFPIMASGAAFAGSAATFRLVKLVGRRPAHCLQPDPWRHSGRFGRGVHHQGNAGRDASLARCRGRALRRRDPASRGHEKSWRDFSGSSAGARGNRLDGAPIQSDMLHCNIGTIHYVRGLHFSGKNNEPA